MENVPFWKQLGDRLLPPKAKVGFLQEIDPASGVIKNSSTRIIQIAALCFFPYHLQLVYEYLGKKEVTDLADVGVLFVTLLVHVIVIVAPKMLKNTVVIQSMLNAIGKNKTEKKD